MAFDDDCTTWLLAADEGNSQNFQNFQSAKQQPPWLMLAEKPGMDFREFFSLATHKIHRVLLPEANGKRCLASHGWLFIIEKTLDINLVHPLTRTQIPLPHISKFKDWDSYLSVSQKHIRFIEKACLSMTPTDLTVGVIYGSISKVAFAKPGDKTWKAFDSPSYHVACADIIYYQGQFYGIDFHTRVLVYDVSDSNPYTKLARVISVIPEGFFSVLYYCQHRKKNIPFVEQIYLVESSGSLLVITREGDLEKDKKSYKTTRFRVFELDVKTGIWSKVSKLGNRALFLGHNSSFSIEVTGQSYCKPNCIYFTEDNEEFYVQFEKGGGKDMGIYNLLDGTFEQHFKGESYSHVTPPMWVEPTFQDKYEKPHVPAVSLE